MKIPGGTVQQQLRGQLAAGKTPEHAVQAVMGPYQRVLAAAGNDSLAAFARPAVLAEARRLHQQLTRRAEDRAFAAARGRGNGNGCGIWSSTYGTGPSCRGRKRPGNSTR